MMAQTMAFGPRFIARPIIRIMRYWKTPQRSVPATTSAQVAGGQPEGGNMADGAAAQPATATATHTAQLSSW